MIVESSDGDVLISLFEKFGLPVAMLVAIVWWLIKASKWVAPRIDKLVERHEKLLETLEEELRTHGRLLEQIEETQESIFGFLKELKVTADGIKGAARDIANHKNGVD